MRHIVGPFLTVVSLALVLAAPANGTGEESPTAPTGSSSARGEQIPSAVPRVDASAAPTNVQDRPPAYVLPDPGWPSVEFVRPDPLLARPDYPQAGWYFNQETIATFSVHFRQQFQNQLVINANRTDKIGFMNGFPGNQLNPTASARFEVGYRLCDGWGAFQLGYRFLATQGRENFVSDQGLGNVAQVGRLDFNVVDLDYVADEWALGRSWKMRWGIGVRTYTLFYDEKLSLLDAGAGPGGNLLGQIQSNSNWGIGVRASLNIERKLGDTPMTFFTRLQGADEYARITQTATESFSGLNAGDADFTQRIRQHTAVGVPTLEGAFGLTYELPNCNHSRLMAGWSYESWFQVGRLNLSRGQLDLYGLFLRGEFNF